MFFSKKPQIVVYLRRDSLDVFGKSAAKFVFPDGLVQNLEVEDSHLLHDQTLQFLTSQQIVKESGILLLDDSVVFQKVMPVSANSNIKALQDDYAQRTPFDPSGVVVVGLLAREQLILIAANKNFFMPIVAAFSDYGSRINSVSPAGLFGKGVITQDSAETILANAKNAEKANFLQI
ncbi:MAG TPA: hypothetical protein VLA77_01535 [Candidatus Saccharimonadales bacterium]|nr:hypothetical protein [Candidatus Saccharimonadales bacterium]